MEWLSSTSPKITLQSCSPLKIALGEIIMKLGTIFLLPLVALSLILPLGGARANNVEVKHVALKGEAVGSHVMVEFDLRWENSWRNDLAGAGQTAPFNYDAAWLFVKFSTDGGATWQHATLSAVSADHSVLIDNGVAATMEAVPDGRGAFIFRAANGAGTNNWDDVQLRWNYSADGLASITTSTIVNVLAIEMVFIPEGSFFAGDQSPDPIEGQFEDGVSGNPLAIVSAGALTLGGGGAGSLGNNNAEGMSHADDFNDGASQILPAAFPKGFAAFYVMKYEIAQGQYADFLNLLTAAQAAKRDITGEANYTQFRGTVAGNYPLFSAAAADRACNFLSWMDGAAYADWAGLRPITELEYEKAGRGNQAVVSEEYAWGNTFVMRQTGHSGVDGNGAETATPAGANANFEAGISGPVRAGIYSATSGGSRADAGASFYGVMELSGNLWERTVTVGKASGRDFTGTHGDGILTTTAGFEGNATNADWPGIDGVTARGVTSGLGAGFRGGGWTDQARHLQLASRVCAPSPENGRTNQYGFRCVRTAP
jgi:formylglycine-generating enzyme required for sulfatase activity